jgi:pimeloyl-ACP methyl ester carboxylesterase
MKALARAAPLVLLTLLIACSTTEVPPEQQLTVTSQHEVAIDCGFPFIVHEVRGTVGPGADFLLYAPKDYDWRDLVVYAHGYVSTHSEVGFFGDDPDTDLLDEIELLRSGIICPIPEFKKAYAAAFSSYSENGFAVKRGAQQTHQVTKLFTKRFGKPRHTFLAGASLGGGITTYLAERFPSQYDGALALCGFVSGSVNQLTYLADTRNVFDYFYPGVLPEDALNVPEGLRFDDVAPSIIAAITAEALAEPGLTVQKALALASIEQIQLPLRGTNLPVPNEIFASMTQSLLSALFYNIDGTNAFLEDTHGRSPYDNSDTDYRYSNPLLSFPLIDLEDLNEKVARFESTPDARNYLEHYFTPTGKLKIPMVTMHTTGDPAVPFFHEAAYAEIVAQAGATPMLQQIPIERYGHCQFELPEVIGAFAGLATWVETGINPF